MKCTLELYGKTYESTEFTERQVSLFLAASAGATGINIKDLFEELMGSQQMSVRGLREYSSLESAEKDLDLVLKRVFPTLNRSIESIDTTELITIVRPMLFALAGVEAPIETPEVTPAIEQKTPVLLTQPPDIELNEIESGAVTEAAKELGTDRAIVDCWYRWWKALDEADDDKLPVNDALEVIIDVSKNDFDLDETLTFHKAISRILKSIPLTAEPIAA